MAASISRDVLMMKAMPSNADRRTGNTGLHARLSYRRRAYRARGPSVGSVHRQGRLSRSGSVDDIAGGLCMELIWDPWRATTKNRHPAWSV